MFSPRFLAAFALLAAVAAVPVSNDTVNPKPITTISEDEVDDFGSWFRGPWDNLFSTVFQLVPSFADITPNITASEENVQVIVNVKNYEKDDLTVTVKGEYIFVQGSHEVKNDDKNVVASQFFHTYSLPVNASAADVTAELTSDGFLVINTPLNGANDKESDDREVPITETGLPHNKDENTDVEKAGESTSPAQPVTENVEDKKEGTTVSHPEDLTEQDNVIPHGNPEVIN